MAQPSPVFGPLFVPATLEQSLIDLLKKYFPTYIREAEYQLDMPIGRIGPPLHYTNRNNFDSLPGEQNPRCVVINTGLAGPPILSTNQAYRASWRIGIGLAVAHSEEVVAKLLADIYAACATKILMDRTGKEIKNVSNVLWESASYDDLPIPSPTNFYKGAVTGFIIEMINVAIKGLGPDEPDPNIAPPVNWPTAETVIVDIVKEAL
jgi:hypothetical protein